MVSAKGDSDPHSSRSQQHSLIDSLNTHRPSVRLDAVSQQPTNPGITCFSFVPRVTIPHDVWLDACAPMKQDIPDNQALDEGALHRFELANAPDEPEAISKNSELPLMGVDQAFGFHDATNRYNKTPLKSAKHALPRYESSEYGCARLPGIARIHGTEGGTHNVHCTCGEHNRECVTQI